MLKFLSVDIGKESFLFLFIFERKEGLLFLILPQTILSVVGICTLDSSSSLFSFHVVTVPFLGVWVPVLSLVGVGPGGFRWGAKRGRASGHLQFREVSTFYFFKHWYSSLAPRNSDLVSLDWSLGMGSFKSSYCATSGTNLCWSRSLQLKMQPSNQQHWHHLGAC